MTPDLYAAALERADEDEQEHLLAEHFDDRGLVPPLIFGRPVMATSSSPSGHGSAGAPLDVSGPRGQDARPA